MKNITAGIFILALTWTVWGKPNAPDEAKTLFEQGDYLGGTNLLMTSMNDADPNRRAVAFVTFAEYQENLVGNVDYAVRLYADTITLPLPEDNSQKVNALEQLRRLYRLKKQCLAEDVLLRSLQPPDIAEPACRSRQLSELRSIAENNPEYYRIYEVYYHLGRHYMVTEDFYLAYIFLKKSLEIKPAINFYLPLNTFMERAHASWVRSTIGTISLGVIGILSMVAFASFYLCRPWKWLRLRHVGVWLAAVLLWLIVFVVFYEKLAGRQTMPDESIIEISAAPPYFLDFGPSSPFWSVARNLFIYGLAGTTGVFLFSIGTSRLKSRWTVIFSNGLFAFLFFTGLMTIFYLRNCDQKSIFFSPSQQGYMSRISGANYFVNYGMEPYILTNPKAYPDLVVENAPNEHFHQWMKTYCPITPSGVQNKP